MRKSGRGRPLQQAAAQALRATSRRPHVYLPGVSKRSWRKSGWHNKNVRFFSGGELSDVELVRWSAKRTIVSRHQSKITLSCQLCPTLRQQVRISSRSVAHP
jgi:hypothetical protein